MQSCTHDVHGIVILGYYSVHTTMKSDVDDHKISLYIYLTPYSFELKSNTCANAYYEKLIEFDFTPPLSGKLLG